MIYTRVLSGGAAAAAAAPGFRLNLTAFIVAFALGMAFIYIHRPATQVIVQAPTPLNAGHVVYKNPAGDCFVLEASRLESCPANAKPIKIAG